MNDFTGLLQFEKPGPGQDPHLNTPAQVEMSSP